MGKRFGRLLLFLGLLAVAAWFGFGHRVDESAVTAALAKADVTCRNAGQADGEHYFLVAPTVLETDDGDVLVYQCWFTPLALWQAGTVGNGGYSIGTAMIHWPDPPHFYRYGSTLVQYVGSNDAICEALTKLMGQQFAGAARTEK